MYITHKTFTVNKIGKLILFDSYHKNLHVSILDYVSTPIKNKRVRLAYLSK